MSRKDLFNIYVGCKTGTLTGVKIRKNDCLTKNVKDYVTASQNVEVTTACWGDDDEREILVACGVDNDRRIKVYDTDCSMYTSTFFCDCGKGRITGISRYDEAILTAVHSGEIKLWKFREEDGFVLNAGDNLHRMRHSSVDKNVIATGGLDNVLKLFDMSRQQQIFVEKNLPNDWLQLRVPIWISDINFFPYSDYVATVSRYGHIRLYDPKTQRRPVINLEIKDEAWTTMAVTPQERQIIVGSGKGRMNLVDLRSPAKLLNTYKGFTGGVTGIACSKNDPYVLSVSLDRQLRVHHIQTKRMVKKIYLTSKLSTLVLRSNFSLPVDGSEKKENVQESKSNVETEAKSDEEYDVLFDSMQKIGNKTDSKLIEKKSIKRQASPSESVTRKAEETVSNQKRKRNN